MRHGAVDFLDKCDPPHVLLSSLQGALANDAANAPRRARRKAVERRFDALTAREREVLRHVVQGKMNKQIAAALGIHERTVKLHRKRDHHQSGRALGGRTHRACRARRVSGRTAANRSLAYP